MKILLISIFLVLMSAFAANAAVTCDLTNEGLVSYCYNVCPQADGVGDNCVQTCILSYISQCQGICDDICDAYADYVCNYQQGQVGGCGSEAYEYCEEALSCDEPEVEIPEFGGIAAGLAMGGAGAAILLLRRRK